jgi:hypothetical protein
MNLYYQVVKIKRTSTKSNVARNKSGMLRICMGLGILLAFQAYPSPRCCLTMCQTPNPGMLYFNNFSKTRFTEGFDVEAALTTHHKTLLTASWPALFPSPIVRFLDLQLIDLEISAKMAHASSCCVQSSQIPPTLDGCSCWLVGELSDDHAPHATSVCQQLLS